MNDYSWVPIAGKFEVAPDRLTYKGEMTEWEGKPIEGFGMILTNARFSGGAVSGTVTFSDITERCGADLLLSSDPERGRFVAAGLGGVGRMFAIRQTEATVWRDLGFAGDRSNLRSGEKYRLRATLRGSKVTLEVNGVHVLTNQLTFTPAQGQTGFMCSGATQIALEDFSVGAEKQRAFVVMQFGSPFDEFHREVIKIICEEFGLEAVRADESYKPTVIISEIAQQIAEAKVVIAEITPSNPNVYYEVGYAHALGKPTILIADRSKVGELPFDLSAWRTLFYENSIAGKSRIEEGLRKHLRAILEVT